MKKIAILLVVIMLALPLTACSTILGMIPLGPISEKILDIDFDEIFAGNGESNIIYDNLTDAQKEKLIEKAKEEGYEITFGSDGTMTIKDRDGAVAVQNPDGTWTFESEEDSGQFGGSWPENEFTKLVPKPDFKLVAAAVNDDNEFYVFFSGASKEEIQDYVEKVKEAGFTLDAETTDETVLGLNTYMFEADNEDGYHAEVMFSSLANTSGIKITGPR